MIFLWTNWYPDIIFEQAYKLSKILEEYQFIPALCVTAIPASLNIGIKKTYKNQ